MRIPALLSAILTFEVFQVLTPIDWLAGPGVRNARHNSCERIADVKMNGRNLRRSGDPGRTAIF